MDCHVVNRLEWNKQSLPNRHDSIINTVLPFHPIIHLNLRECLALHDFTIPRLYQRAGEVALTT